MRAMAQLVMVHILLVFVPAVASAQAGAALTGIVTDSSGAVLPGVTVEARSPALIEQVRSAVTDETGRYRIVDLRPGTYSVTFVDGSPMTFACRRSSSHSHRGPSGPPQSLDQSQARASKTNAFDASTGNRPIRVQPSSAVAECSDIASCLWRAESLTCAWRIAILQAFFEVWIPKTPRTEPTKSQQFLNGNTSWRRFLVPMLD